MNHLPVVSRQFRQAIAHEMPGLGNDPALWRLLLYLCFGTRRDYHTGRLLLSGKTLAWLEGVEYSAYYSGDRFLQRFRDRCHVVLTLTEPDPSNHQARTVKAFIPSVEAERLIVEERLNQDVSDCVDIVTGQANKLCIALAT